MSDRPDGTAGRSDGSRDPSKSRGVPSEGRDLDALAARLSALERTVTDGENPISRSSESAGPSADPGLDGGLQAIEGSLDDLDARLAEVEAATQALRGYVGAVRAVNREVERRADAALAAVERIEGYPNEDLAATAPDDALADAESNGSDLDRVAPSSGVVERDDDGRNDGLDGTDGDEQGGWGVAERLRDAL